MWSAGQTVLYRGIVHDRVWSAIPVIVVKDSGDESVLLVLPGAQCVYPEGYFQRKRGDFSAGTRWQEMARPAWNYREFFWQTNRFLIFLEPDKYYAIYHIWRHNTDQFSCYYINFQLPFRRSHCGLDSLDLDLDLVVDPEFRMNWKDERLYREGIRDGGIRPEWANAIEASQPEVLDRIARRRYPLDGAWVHWRPEPAWNPPSLPDGWADL